MSFDYLSSKKIFITCCEKGFVKIWDSNKNIIREITFSDPINSACFLNNEGDILICHRDKVTMIVHQMYGLNEQPN